MIRFAFASCAMWSISNLLLMFAFWMHWYLYNANKPRVITARERGNDGISIPGVEVRSDDFHRRANNPLVRPQPAPPPPTSMRAIVNRILSARCAQEIERKEMVQDYRREMVAKYGQVPSRRQRGGDSVHDTLL
eukprot:COSAG02_NODE_2983_length_7620_cov_73.890271_6_plen_134_part_00